MTYAVLIRRNSDGLVRRREMKWDWKDSDYYWWTEGNFGCDCNRHLEFQRAADEDEDGDDCGETRYTVLKAILPDNTEIPIDG